jgi:hypothetical protein
MKLWKHLAFTWSALRIHRTTILNNFYYSMINCYREGIKWDNVVHEVRELRQKRCKMLSVFGWRRKQWRRPQAPPTRALYLTGPLWPQSLCQMPVHTQTQVSFSNFPHLQACLFLLCSSALRSLWLTSLCSWWVLMTCLCEKSMSSRCQ